jgi:tRNA threonylcarbamoyladenosine biosynthesis protein TsaB
MLTLAVDTTADYGSIALADEKGVREETLLHAPQGFSHVLFGEIEALLKRQGVRLADIELFAGASGPGSFTGVRVGLSAMKGLAEVLGKKVVAVSNLEAAAEYGTSAARAVVIDARRGEVYAAVYGGAGHQIVQEVVAPFLRFVAMLPDTAVEWVSPDEDVLTRLLGENGLGSCPVTTAPRAIAGVIARIAILRKNAMDPAGIEANYVRRSDAELLYLAK